MPLVIKNKDEESVSPHLALTHKVQGGAANGRNISLLMKSGEMSEAIAKALESLGVEQDVVKASYYGQIRSVLQSAVTEQFGGDDWDEYAYVEDFNDTSVIFCTCEGLFVVNYQLSDNGTVAMLGDVATPVTASVIYTATSGEVKISEDAEEKLEQGVYTLVKSCTTNPSTIEHLTKMFEHKQNKVLEMQTEITKAVEAAVAIEKAAFAEQAAILKAVQDKLAEFESAAAVAKVEMRKSAIVDAKVPADKVEAVLKSLESLSDEAFATTVAVIKAQAALVDNSDLLKEAGVSGAGADTQEEVDRTTQILKAKYAK